MNFTYIKRAVFAVLLTNSVVFSQKSEMLQQLDTVVITSSRIDLPFKKDSKSITIVTSEQIKRSGVTNVADLLQQFAGVDVRRQGVSGMQTNLRIRGGGFAQTLLLIDGIKSEDPQTGHHTMNMALPIDVIERIEIIKGSAARIYGQNAFTGAINIVTKKNAKNISSLGAMYGSFNQKVLNGNLGVNVKNTSIILHSSLHLSDGYRKNTDFKNSNHFIKLAFNKDKTPINLIGYFTEKKFGANQFYAVKSGVNQYEETQSSLVGLTSVYKSNNFTIKPRVSWRRNQDMYLFDRNKPNGYRNLHISNKIGTDINTSYKSSVGITGFGVDFSKVFLRSNRLGNHDRYVLSAFLEHRFVFANGNLDVTPGVAFNYLSDMKKKYFFPGIDIGYQLNDKFKIYTNVGYTVRVPTYTNLYYKSSTTIGNKNLKSEEALSGEIGFKYTNNNIRASIVGFNRNAENLIDYTKETENDKLWVARNFRKVNALGFELNSSVDFNLANNIQILSVSYAYLDENMGKQRGLLSKYTINSLRHHFTTSLKTTFFKNLKNTFTYKYGNKKVNNDDFSVFDVTTSYNFNKLNISLTVNNVFNDEYYENIFVPMPKRNYLAGLKYNF